MNFKLAKKAALGAGLLLAASTASAASATFSDFVDTTGGSLYYDSTPGANVASGNTLTLALNFFEALVSAPLQSMTADDTLAFKVTAPTGYKITSISYTETVTGTTANAVGNISGSFTADGIPVGFPILTYAPGTSSTVVVSPSTISIASKDSIEVSVHNSLFMFGIPQYPGSGPSTGDLKKTAASVTVGLTAVPLPPALGMLGAGVLALVTVGGRRRNNV